MHTTLRSASCVEPSAVIDLAAQLGIPAPAYAPHVRPGLFACWSDRVSQVAALAIAGRSTTAMIAECARYDGRPTDLRAAEARHAAETRAWDLAPKGRRRIDAGHCELQIIRDGVEDWFPLVELTDAELSVRQSRKLALVPTVARAA